MLADMHRARMLAYDLPDCGWDVEVLTPSVAYQQPTWIDPNSVPLRPVNVPVHEAPLCWDGLFRRLTMRSVGWRALWPMYRLGKKLLQREQFDLVYITTTQFNLFCLGYMWWKQLSVPYVLDFHDPWRHESYEYVTTKSGLKFRASSALAVFLERVTVRDAVGLVSVSPNYLEQLERRYPGSNCLRKNRRAVIPFSATERDFSVVRVNNPLKHTCLTRDTLEIAYTGAGGSIMAKSFTRIMQSLARLRHKRPDLINRIRIRLFGTDSGWKPGDNKTLAQIAHCNGLGDLVDEQPERISYIEALELILKADGLLILGVDDPAYMPSKLFTYALAGKPLLACLHKHSQIKTYFDEMPGLGRLIFFQPNATQSTSDEDSEDNKVEQFLVETASRQYFDRKGEIKNYLSCCASRRHAELFETCLAD